MSTPWTTHNMSRSRIYSCWHMMKQRCYNKNKDDYKRYGARGIKVCEKWQTFEGFYEDMLDGYNDELTLDRIDVDKNYSKENCRWVDRTTQQNNRRITKFYTVKGVSDTIANFCRSYNLSYELARTRLRAGWDVEKIFTTPVQKKKVT